MKYFTPSLYERLQDFDPVAMESADADWAAAAERYAHHLQQLGSAIAPVSKRFEGILLHDAAVLAISHRGNELSIVLLKDIPPRDIVTLTYALTKEPIIDKCAVAGEQRSGVMQYEYDEFDVVEENGQSHFMHSILFSNGWEIRIRFRDVHVILGQAVYPSPGVCLPAANLSAMA